MFLTTFFVATLTTFVAAIPVRKRKFNCKCSYKYSTILQLSSTVILKQLCDCHYGDTKRHIGTSARMHFNYLIFFFKFCSAQKYSNCENKRKNIKIFTLFLVNLELKRLRHMFLCILSIYNRWSVCPSQIFRLGLKVLCGVHRAPVPAEGLHPSMCRQKAGLHASRFNRSCVYDFSTVLI